MNSVGSPRIRLPVDVTVHEDPRTLSRLRVSFVTETYPPEVNGVALTVARFVEGLRARGHEVQLVRPKQDRNDQAEVGPNFHEVLMRGMPIPRYPSLRMGVPSKRALVRLWASRRPDLVHIATEGPLGWSALQASKALRLAVTSDFRTNFHAYSEHYGVAWLRTPILAYLRRFHNATLRTFVPTPELLSSLSTSGFRSLSVVARGVDTELFNPARRSAALRESWGVAPDDCVVLCVGRLAPEKNIGLLLSAYADLVARGLRCKLVLVGDGPLRAEVQQRCPGAVVAGQRFGEELATYYASADVFAFPSKTETFGNVVIEAMASGLAVVAFRQAAAAQFIECGSSGLLCEPSEEGEFSAALHRAVTDSSLARSLGAVARLRAESLGWPSTLRLFEAELFSALGRRIATF